jgi:hypothetical protein
MFELTTVLTDDCSVHVIERIAEQFDPLTIGTGEVGRRPIDDQNGDISRLYFGNQAVELLGRHTDADVVQSTEHFFVRSHVESGKGKVRWIVFVADIEEKMEGATVVTILEQFRERTFKHVRKNVIVRSTLFDTVAKWWSPRAADWSRSPTGRK